jgi:hypothetical protein
MAPSWSAVIFAHDAADRIGILAAGLAPHVDEVVVVDIASEDGTAEAASKAGARVIAHPYSRVVETVRIAVLPQIETDWILVLDDDEVPDAQLLRTLTRIVADDALDAVEIPLLNYFFGEPVRGAGWQPEVDRHIRCFRRGALVFSDVIHTKEKPREGGRIRTLTEQEGLLHHFSYVSVSDFLQRSDRYTSVEATRLAGQPHGRLATGRYIYSSLYEVAVRLFFSRRGRGGWRARVLTILMISYRAAAWAKARELEAGLTAEGVTEQYLATAASLLGVVQWTGDVSEDGGRGAGYPPRRR